MDKFKKIKFNFPENPEETDFIKAWEETIQREDFQKLVKEVEEKESKN